MDALGGFGPPEHDLQGGAAVPTSYDRRGFLTTFGRAGALGVLARAGFVGATGAATVGRAGPAWAGGNHIGSGATAYGPEVLQDWFRTLYSGLMDEAWVTPGRAARIYANCAISGYEAVVGGVPHLRSLGGQLNGLGSLRAPSNANAIDRPTAVSVAVGTTAAALLTNASQGFRTALATQMATHVDQRRSAGIPKNVIERSVEHGESIGRQIADWAATDGAAATYTRAYTPPTGPDRWVSTAPNFGSAIDPYWGDVRPMAMPTASACKPPAPIPFSTAPGSAFHDQALAVLRAADGLDDAGKATSLFWRDNPVTSGLPAGHWMRLTLQVCGDRGLDLASSAEAAAIAGIALSDAFISCWHEKYATNLLRPITYIRAHVAGRSTWSSFVNTPQFPEYTSGHSVASQAAATVLTDLMGTVVFTDNTHQLRNPQLGSRSFASFQEAADQAARSRLLGGIHYPMGIDVGLTQGERVGRTVLDRVRTRTR